MRLNSNLLEYLRTKMYTKSEIDEFLAGISSFDYSLVEELPSEGIKGTVYLLRNDNSDSDNLFDGYLYIAGAWELIGPRVDLSDYYVKGEVDGLLNGKAPNIISSSSENGLMSKEDKAKLDTVSPNANHVEVDSALSGTSSNPLQNNIITSALDGKASAIHSHTKGQISDFAHEHDDRYYTEGEVDALLQGKGSLTDVTKNTDDISNLTNDLQEINDDIAMMKGNTLTLTATLADNSTVSFNILKSDTGED